MIGFALPYIALVGLSLLFGDISLSRERIGANAEPLVMPASGCCLLFFLADIFNYTPKKRVRLIRAFGVVGIIQLVGTVIGLFASEYLFESALRRAIAMLIAVLFVVIVTVNETVKQCRRNSLPLPPVVDAES